jgi:hypothetical protein
MEPPRAHWELRLGAVIAAVAVALIVWAVAAVVLGIPLWAPEGFGASGDIDALNVAVTSALISLIAWGLLAILERPTARAHLIWAIAAPVLLVATLATPLSGTGVTPANRSQCC